ncbi:hypothetical protein AVEN_70186-1 [Araneus ventricosus]|uniref:Uncharacterized protein n=1 Tax=Araneus ventricosus TaxID=182803 RepID=A0A4Y2FCC8_ARAVE|nr:hypothetical protein AVEN_70186-1 [Araneus ventricosus]
MKVEDSIFWLSFQPTLFRQTDARLSKELLAAVGLAAGGSCLSMRNTNVGQCPLKFIYSSNTYPHIVTKMLCLFPTLVLWLGREIYRDSQRRPESRATARGAEVRSGVKEGM